MQCPKIGMIKWGGTVSPIKDYQVSAGWVTNLLQMQKMLFVEARVELANLVKNIGRNMKSSRKKKGRKGHRASWH